MLRQLRLFVLTLALAAPASARPSPISAGEQFTLPSAALGETANVYVSLPQSYDRSTDSYPVLYLTDAQWQFDQTRSTAAFLARNGIISEVIVVGVANRDRTRDLYATRADFKQNGRTIPFPTSGHADRFLEFVEKELIPWVEARYRVMPLRILAGHSAGGNFALHVMRVRPRLFQAVIAASPWLAWDDERELKLLLPFVAGRDVGTRALFLSCANETPEMRTEIDTLTSALCARADSTLRWDSRTYEGETHDTAALRSYYDALRMVFAGWSYPRDPETLLLTGSIEDMKVHYARLGERLGCRMIPPELIVNELGYQFLQANDLEQAIATFRYNTVLRPRSANTWDSLGEALERSGNVSEAAASYRKAVSLAVASHDSNLPEFRKHAAAAAHKASR